MQKNLNKVVSCHKKLSWKWIPTILFLIFAISFVLFEITGFVTFDDLINWVKSSGSMAGLIIFLFLLSDIVAPIPSSILIVFAGSIYGPVWGTIIGFTGSISASFVGFFIARRLRRSVLIRLISLEESGRMNLWFHKWGGVGIILSRTVPIVTETMSCLAGFSKMTWKRFFILISLGTLPMSMYHAYVGSISNSPIEWLIYLVLAFVIPVIFWIIFQYFSQRKKFS